MNDRKQPQLVVWWVLWAAFQVGIVFFYYYLGGTTARPQIRAADSPAWLAGFLPFAISAILRWTVLPRVDNAQAAFPLFIMGLAFAEVCCFLGLFIFPAHKQALFFASTLGILQFAPFFASHYYQDGGGNPRP